METEADDLARARLCDLGERQNAAFAILTNHGARTESLEHYAGAIGQTAEPAASNVAQVRAAQDRHHDGLEQLEIGHGLHDAASA